MSEEISFGLQIHHFSWERIFQNVHKSMFVSQSLSQDADSTGHTNLLTCTTVFLLSGTPASSPATGAMSFALQVAIFHLYRKGLEMPASAACDCLGKDL